MAEGTYENEVMRAELLGIDPPDREIFEAARKERLEVEREELEIAQDAELAEQGEQVQGASGKFDELNSILSSTQRKLNKFKTVCGSLTSLIKIRGSTTDLNESGEPAEKNDINEANEALESLKLGELETDVSVAKRSVRDVGQKVTRQLDALDSLINKAERAEASMNYQNQQMKKSLNK